MSGLTSTFDSLTGRSEKKAAKAQQQGIERGIEATEKAAEEAKAAALPLFGQASQDLSQGFQGALDVFGQSLPAQVQAFQGGNVAAQQQLLAGLPQFQNAILGGNVDFSQLQPTQVQTPDLGFFQQQLPSSMQPQQTTVPNSGLGFFTPNNPAFNGLTGPFEMAPSSNTSGGNRFGSGVFGGLANQAIGNLFEPNGFQGPTTVGADTNVLFGGNPRLQARR